MDLLDQILYRMSHKKLYLIILILKNIFVKHIKSPLILDKLLIRASCEKS